jgi:predicted metal-dependent HD superfamily phosphohydrolase
MATASPTIAPHLKKRFEDLALSLSASVFTVRTWSEQFVQRYTEPHRYYHTLAHISSMIACLDVRLSEIKDQKAVELAIFFHDWIYEPQGASNEAESVLVFEKFAIEIGLAANLRLKVVRLVEATVKHEIADNVPSEEDTDMKLFLDFDLEVLGRNWEEYKIYASQIRREYSCFEQQEYNIGRATVLSKFLARDKIYFSDTFCEEEKFARENMRKEIELLIDG